MSEYRIAPIPGFPAYDVTTAGEVLREGRYRLIPRQNNKGYPMVCFYVGGKLKWKLIARLVLETFVGPCPEGMVARHILNNDKMDCRLENLAWGTPTQNIHDKKAHGTFGWKLTARQVINIRKRRAAGESIRDLARKYKLSEGYTGQLCAGEAWAHLIPKAPIRPRKRRARSPANTNEN